MFFEAVSSRYLETFGIRLFAGRWFNDNDTIDRPQVLIINEGMARRFWPNERAVGKRVGRPGPNRSINWMEVVGVVNDIGFPGSLAEPRTGPAGVPADPQGAPPFMTLAVRTSLTPELLVDPVRRAFAEIEPTLSVARVRPARSMVEQGLGSVSLLATLLGAFAALGLTLAAIGICGVTSYSVVQRTNEIGIRTAVGAQARDVLWMVLAKGSWLIVSGALVGAAGAHVVARLLMSAVPTLPTRDPLAMLGMTLTLIAVALVACYRPARRATKVDPLAALRHE